MSRRMPGGNSLIGQVALSAACGRQRFIHTALVLENTDEAVTRGEYIKRTGRWKKCV